MHLTVGRVVIVLILVVQFSVPEMSGQATATVLVRNDTLAPQDPLLFNGTPGHPYHLEEIQLLPGQLYEVSLRSQQFDAYLRVLDEASVEVSDDDSGGGRDARLSIVAGSDADGDGLVTYRIQATSLRPGEFGAYELVGVPGPVSTTLLSRTDSTWRRSILNEPYDSVRVEASGGIIRVALRSSPQALDLSAHFADGTSIGTSEMASVGIDRPERGMNAHHLEFPAPGEAFSLFVYGFPGSPTQTYTMRVHANPSGEGSTTSYTYGTLEPGDARLPDGSYFDIAGTLPVGWDEVVTIELRSNEFDPFLVVDAPGTGFRWEDDDSAGLLNSRVQIKGQDWISRGGNDGQLRVFVSAIGGERGSWILVVGRSFTELVAP